MSVRVMNLVWPANLPAMDKLVLLYLADHANDDGNSAYPSVDRLSAGCSLTRRAVQKILRRLEKREVIILQGGAKGGRGRTRNYRISPERANVVHPIKGERGSPFPAKRANESAIKGERGSPEPSLTIKELSDSVVAPLFDDFWRTFPSRRPHPNPRKPARQKFDAALKRGVSATDIIRGAENFAVYVTQERTEPKFIAQAVTWLSQERWAEYQVEPEPATPAAAGWL